MRGCIFTAPCNATMVGGRRLGGSLTQSSKRLNGEAPQSRNQVAPQTFPVQDKEVPIDYERLRAEKAAQAAAEAQQEAAELRDEYRIPGPNRVTWDPQEAEVVSDRPPQPQPQPPQQQQQQQPSPQPIVEKKTTPAWLWALVAVLAAVVLICVGLFIGSRIMKSRAKAGMANAMFRYGGGVGPAAPSLV
jgi:hypothetical protein